MHRVIGVIGGMGPEATLAFAQRLYELAPTAVEQARPHLLIDCNPAIPDRNRALAREGPSPVGALAEMAKRLTEAGAQLLVMPCNTAHAFASAITEASPLPFVSIIDSTVDQVAHQTPSASRVGLLATTVLIAEGLYQRALSLRGKNVIAPEAEDQAELMSLIYAVKTGGGRDGLRARAAAIADGLVRRGAQLIVAACTEIPLVLAASDVGVPLIDSTEALARATLREAAWS